MIFIIKWLSVNVDVLVEAEVVSLAKVSVFRYFNIRIVTVLSRRIAGRHLIYIAVVSSMLILFIAGPALGLSSRDANETTTYRWYFAEGFTGAGFQEYLCVGNPGSGAAGVTVSFLFNGRRSIEIPYEIPPVSRHTFDVNKIVGPGNEVSIVVRSENGDLAVERSLYFEYQGRYAGSHIVQGATSESDTWYFAEGYTGPGFDEYICVLNPGDRPVALTFRLQTAVAEEVLTGQEVPANSRATFKVNDLLGNDREVSTKLESNHPVVAERSVYFNYQGIDSRDWEGGHCVMGSTLLTRDCLFAEGTTRSGFDEWLTIQNPNDSALVVTATYQFEAGQGSPVTRDYRVEGRRRYTIFLPDEVGYGKDVCVRLTSSTPFLAERPMYYGFAHSGLQFEGGHCAMGITESRKQWFFAEGYTGPYFEEWLSLQNCSDEAATVEIEYFTQERGALSARTVTVPAHSRKTIFVNEHAGPDLQVSTRLTVCGETGIVAERPMYFDRLGMPTGVNSDILFGLCFSPYLVENPLDGGWVSVEEVAGLMDRIAPYTRWIRTFGSEGEWDAMPGLAIERGLRIAAGCDIYTDLARNQREVDALIAQVKRGEVDLAVVGDEVLLMNALSEDQLIGYIRQVKASGATTTTSEAYTEWIAHPKLVAECDVLTVNIFPYWEGLPVDGAIAYLDCCYEQVRQVAGGKKIIVETGWPSGGQVVGDAVPGPQNAAVYLDEFMSWAQERGVEYFYFEAFDEQWKAGREGPCGCHWGLWTDQAELKPEISKVISTWK